MPNGTKGSMVRRAYHLHRREDGDLVALLDDVALLDLDVDHDARHGRADLARVDGLLAARDVQLDRRVGDGHEPPLAVELEDAPAVAVRVGLRERDDLDQDVLARLEVEGNLLPLDERLEEEVGVELAHLAVDLHVLLPLVEDFGVEGVREDVHVRDRAVAPPGRAGERGEQGQPRSAEVSGGAFVGALGGDTWRSDEMHGDLGRLYAPLLEDLGGLLKVEVFEGGPRAPLDGAAAAGEDAGAQGLGEAAGRHAELALEVLDDGLRQGERLGLLDDHLGGEVLRNHELGKVADDL